MHWPGHSAAKANQHLQAPAFPEPPGPSQPTHRRQLYGSSRLQLLWLHPSSTAVLSTALPYGTDGRT